MAMNSSPARIVRESIDTPAAQAKGSSPAPARVPSAPATCAIVHRISSSKDSSYSSILRFGVFSTFEGSSFQEVRHWPVPACRDPSALVHKLRDKRARCQTLSRLVARLFIARRSAPAFPALQNLLRAKRDGAFHHPHIQTSGRQDADNSADR